MPEAHARRLRTESEPARPARPGLRVVAQRDGTEPRGQGQSSVAGEPRGRDDLAAAPDRRTVRISGETRAPRPRSSRTVTGVAARPDRIALWAVVLGLFLALMAVVTARAEPAAGPQRSPSQALSAP